MRVSERYHLGRTQPSLEFLDVAIDGDTKAFIDPRAIQSVHSDWGQQCLSALRTFFDAVFQAIRDGDDALAQGLLASLREPNETRLGLSKGRPKGRGMGDGLAEIVWDSFSNSRAVETGLIEDLEDSALFVKGIGHDVISDVTTNIIRERLIEFTQDAANYYGIPLVRDVNSGQIWDQRSRYWTNRYTNLPVTEEGPLLLVPKSIVRRNQTFDPADYYTHFVLPQLESDEWAAGSSLVITLKNGRRRITKKDLKAKHGAGKQANLSTTLKHPDLLQRYRASKSHRQLPPHHDEIADLLHVDLPDWDALLLRVLEMRPGASQADDYHRAVEALLTALLYPALDAPSREFQIHDGRKRIDITYLNSAVQGFFHWVSSNAQVPVPMVFVECKNYGSEIGNPELDQLSGRFSPNRGRLGLLIYRGFGDKQLVKRRCRDTANDDRGFILALDDEDLAALVAERKRSERSLEFTLLRDRFVELIA